MSGLQSEPDQTKPEPMPQFEIPREFDYDPQRLHFAGNLKMSTHPPKELLDETHSFPCRFMFKAIGRTHDDFASRVVAVVRLTLEQDFDAPYEVRETSAGRHIAVTIEPWVESSQQVIEIYNAIRALEGLVMLM